MKNQVLGYESPLYGRRTTQFKIQALTYREITAFNPQLSAEQQEPREPVIYNSVISAIAGGASRSNEFSKKWELNPAFVQNI